MARKRQPSRKRARAKPTPKSAPRPIAGADAFTNLREPDHVHSQAATLLLIGSHLRGDHVATRARVEAAMALTPAPTPTVAETLPAEDVQALGFPTLRVGAPRFRPEALQLAAGVRFVAAPAPQPAPRDAREASRNLHGAASAFYRDANPETAAALLEVSLRHPHELVRVSAAASYVDVVVDPTPALLVLEHGVRSRDRLTRDVAGHALAHVDPRNPRWRS